MTATQSYPEIDKLLADIASISPPPPTSVHALPDKEYLEATLLPLLVHGLEATARERPKDPLEYLAAYLISNNPQRSDPLPTPPASLPMLYGYIANQALPGAASGSNDSSTSPAPGAVPSGAGAAGASIAAAQPTPAPAKK